MKSTPSLGRLVFGSFLATILLIAVSACTEPDQTGEDPTGQEDTTRQMPSEEDTNAIGLSNPNDRLVIVNCCEPDSVAPNPVNIRQGARLYFSLVNASSAAITLPPEVLMPGEDTTKRVMPHDGSLSVSFHIRNADEIVGSHQYRIEVDGCPRQQRVLFLRPSMIVQE